MLMTRRMEGQWALSLVLHHDLYKCPPQQHPPPPHPHTQPHTHTHPQRGQGSVQAGCYHCRQTYLAVSNGLLIETAPKRANIFSNKAVLSSGRSACEVKLLIKGQGVILVIR